MRHHHTSITFSVCQFCTKEFSHQRRYKRTYCSLKCTSSALHKRAIDKFLQTGEIGLNLKVLRKYLLETRGHRCECCNRVQWNKQPIPLEIEHIDGNSENNNMDNLKLLCPNCHAQTPTYKGKNKGKGRHSRRQRYQDGKSY